jgi:zinc transport system ATP-binding protein
MSDIHIKLDGVNFSYDKKNSVLLDIGFSVGRNEVAAFVGPNGGGKTTLLRLLAGLLKADCGHIYVNGNCRHLSDNACLFGYVPQYAHFDKQFPMTVFDVVLSGLIKPFGFYSRKDKSRAEGALQQLGLTCLKERPISELSGGQAQRMLIARALVSPKEILLLDEPTANIDQQSSTRLKELIAELSETLTILVVTHDMGFIHDGVDRLFNVNGTLQEISLDKRVNQLDSLSSSLLSAQELGAFQ